MAGDFSRAWIASVQLASQVNFGEMDMTLSPTFRKAFLAGLAAPVELHGRPTPYMAYVDNTSLAQHFAEVGRYLSAAYGQIASDEQPEQASFDF
jgi:hypothetical protein